jgi:hypothetical protein
MTDEEKKKFKDLEDANKKLSDDLKKATDSITDLNKKIVDKDLLIEQKNNDIISVRKNYKKLADMTQEEKDQLSQAELELKERMEKFEQDQAEFAKKTEEQTKKEVDARKNTALKKLVGEKNPELLKKVLDNFERIKDSEKALTEEEIGKLANDAYNMLGDEKPNPVLDAMNQNGEAPGDSVIKTDEARLSQIATEMGLPAEAPAGQQ